jgi:hypothetical protein
MNPGGVEEVGKVATGVIDALKNQPMMIALIIFNLTIIIALFFGISSERKDTGDIMKTLIAQCSDGGRK